MFFSESLLLGYPMGAPISLNTSFDFVTPAREGGWRHVSGSYPGETWAGVVHLALGHQTVTVRFMQKNATLSEEDNDQILRALIADMAQSYDVEQYLVLDGYPTNQVNATGSLAGAVVHRRIHVGTYADYVTWARSRLGPLAKLHPDNPVRKLMEPMLCVTSQRSTGISISPAKSFKNSAIEKSFDIGFAGCAAVEAILRKGLGNRNVENVEEVLRYQNEDVDLLAHALGSQLKVEVKTETVHKYKNLVYEWTSNKTKGTPGWLRYTTADILVSVMWPTGDVFVQEFQAVKNWLETTKRNIPRKDGHSPGQTYYSEVLLGKVAYLLEDVKEVVHFSLHDWLPNQTTAGNEPTLVDSKFKHKSIHPQRPILF